VLARESRGTFLVVYIARVRVTVQADDATIIRESHGTSEGRGTSRGEVHDIALKAAETDATKRALATFRKPFGLELYRGGKAAVQKSLPLPDVPVPADARTGFHPDDTTPIPRPSRCYGRRKIFFLGGATQPATNENRYCVLAKLLSPTFFFELISSDSLILDSRSRSSK
jgi:hypothetical protein